MVMSHCMSKACLEEAWKWQLLCTWLSACWPNQTRAKCTSVWAHGGLDSVVAGPYHNFEAGAACFNGSSVALSWVKPMITSARRLP